MRYLRTNTATRVTVGPFLDNTDGVTPEVALTVTNCHLTFSCDTAGVPTLILDVAPTASGGSNDMVHMTGDDAGLYDLELAAANVNYLGRAILAITDAANHCPVFHEFNIITAAEYDRLFSTAGLPATLKRAQALANFQFLMTDSTNHAPATGKTVTVTRALDAGAFASGTLSAVTEISNGMYRVDFATGDTTATVMTLRATASGCDDLLITFLIEQ